MSKCCTQTNSSVGDRTLWDDLPHLKRLGLIDSRGHGPGTVWLLAATPKPEEGNPNKAD
jgi:hypothetical protein